MRSGVCRTAGDTVGQKARLEADGGKASATLKTLGFVLEVVK